MAIDRKSRVYSLYPYASSPGQIGAIEAWLELGTASRLTISYLLTGDLSRLRIAPLAAPGRADRLWQHTCFEAFIAVAGAPAYYEYNFSPSREWAVLAFRAYRDGESLDDDGLAPEILTSVKDGRLALIATIRLDPLPMIRPSMTVRVGLSAVIEGTEGTLSYWALNHPAEKPDFHHPDSFVLELALPQKSA